MRKSQAVSLIAVFAALHVVLYFVSFGLWRNWAIYLESVEGIVLGPEIGFSAALLGSGIARMVKPDVFWMFGVVAEPVGVLMAGLLSRARWKLGLAIYVTMLSAYFLSPFGRELPLWTILDILIGLVLIYPAARFSRNLFGGNVKRVTVALILISFVCTVTDSLVRVFLLVPCGFYTLFPSFFSGFNALLDIFVAAAVDSYIEDLLVVFVSLIVGVPLVVAVLKLTHKGKDGKSMP